MSWLILYQLAEIQNENDTDSVENIWAVTCDFQQCGILASVDSDEPV